MSYKDRNFKSDYNRYTTLSQSFLITELVKKPQILLCWLTPTKLTFHPSNVRVLFLIQVYSLFLANEE